MNEIIDKLEETFKDVTDITDPSSMDMVLMVLEETRMQDEEYMEILVRKLKKEEVTWEQPWYQLGYCLTRKPQSSKIEEEKEKYDTGPFTKDERDLIEQNWKSFVSHYEVPDKPLCLARWRNRNKIRNKNCPEEWVRYYVVAFLAQGLKRNLYDVNKYFMHYYASPVKLRHYTALEEKIMEIAFYHRPQEAVVILSAVLGRDPRGIYNKLNDYYIGKPDGKIVKWTLKLASKLVNKLMEYSGCTLDELKNNEFDRSIWLKLEKCIGQEYKYIHAFWYSTLHVQLFAKCDIKMTSLRKMICKRLQKSRYRVWTDVRWKELAKEFPDGFTGAFLYSTAARMVQKYPDYLTSPLSEVLRRAMEDKTLKFRKKRLKPLRMSKKGRLKYTLYDVPFKQLMKPSLPE